MSLEVLQQLVSFGMMIVLWLVQLVIYPSFLKIENSKLQSWHTEYTFRVSFVILPLMLSQLALASYFLFAAFGLQSLLIFFLVSATWLLTFFVSVPLHRKIERGDRSIATRERLIQTNWPRTVIWTLLFGLSL